MSIAHRDRFEALMPFRDAMNAFFEEGLLRPMHFGPMGRLFPVDVYETEEAFIVEAVLPGVKPDDVKVTAIRDTLTVHATIRPALHAKTDKAGAYVQRERYTGEMTRAVQLPTPIEPDKVSATYALGVLTLQVPKVPAAEPATIPIRVTEGLVAH